MTVVEDASSHRAGRTLDDPATGYSVDAGIADTRLAACFYMPFAEPSACNSGIPGKELQAYFFGPDTHRLAAPIHDTLDYLLARASGYNWDIASSGVAVA
jgi:hypothetical protein